MYTALGAIRRFGISHVENFKTESTSDRQHLCVRRPDGVCVRVYPNLEPTDDLAALLKEAADRLEK